jgi:hypothetical protein
VVDVAFHYYGKPLNFADTPQILSKRPPLPGLDLEDKLNFVREQAKWLASIASTLSSRGTSGIRPSVPSFRISESSRGAISAHLELRSFSETSLSLRCGGADEAEDGVSQPRSSWVHPIPMASVVANTVETTEPDLGAADDAGVSTDLGEGQSTLQVSVENATADSCDSEKHAAGAFSDLVSSPGAEQSNVIRNMCKAFLTMSPPAPVCQTLLEEQENCSYHVSDRLWEE